METQNPQRRPGKIARLRTWFREWFQKKSFVGKSLVIFLLVWLIAFIFAERSVYSVLLLKLRIYAPVLIIFGGILWALYKYVWKRFTPKKKLIWGIALIVLLVMDIAWFKVTPWGMYDYVTSYYRYRTIKKVQISMLPETDHEAIQPAITIQTVAGQQLQGVSTISRAFIVKDSAQYRWTLTLQPNTFWQRIFGNIETIYNVPSETSSLDFSGDNQSAVSFQVGDGLYLSRNARTATLRKLSLFQLFSYEVGEPRFMKDDNKEWVQVVPLIRWKGIIFPQPEFGGVNVIRQSRKHGVGNMVQRFLFGAGTIYSPKQMKQFAYLQNQNLMPEKVTLSIAESFRFQKGFTAPLPSNHKGDVLVPSFEGDIDEQPQTTFFKMSKVANANDMLYEYIGLQTYDRKKDGLVTSVFIPSDGEMVVYVYQHDQKTDGVTGATAMPSWVRERFPTWNKDNNKVTAIRPYNKIINGTMHSLWRATVVTKATHGEGWISSVDSKIALINTRSQTTVWVDAQHPETWVAEIEKAMKVAQKK